MSPLSFAYFSLRRQRKVGAAPHRGNANRPEAKQGKANPKIKPKKYRIKPETKNKNHPGEAKKESPKPTKLEKYKKRQKTPHFSINRQKITSKKRKPQPSAIVTYF
ncbi:MAG: hypothetical protein AB1704_10610 [Pseudomonadota bacterium]|uniref:hypothetical protein n=2 Tax=Burkholderiaceae TaxID=119060 RepID=UPI0010F91651|nr:hypothetical protein [Burkholderia sp. 4M9327F10]